MTTKKPSKRKAREFRLIVSKKRGDIILEVSENVNGVWYYPKPVEYYDARKLIQIKVREVLPKRKVKKGKV
jgi:uridylate kinase